MSFFTYMFFKHVWDPLVSGASFGGMDTNILGCQGPGNISFTLNLIFNFDLA